MPENSRSISIERSRAGRVQPDAEASVPTDNANDRTDATHLCFHCGTPCAPNAESRHDKSFCCTGCLIVFELLTAHGLHAYYNFGETAGVRIGSTKKQEEFAFLDARSVAEGLVDFANGQITKITLHIPNIHCVACVWLLENLFRLNPAIGESRVNFLRREVSIRFNAAELKLSELVALLASLGYEPELKLADLSNAKWPSHSPWRQWWLQTGVAGFAFGNIMLFSIATYLGLDSFSGPAFQKQAGLLSLVLALPVVTYSASDYWRSAWSSLRRRALSIEVPIAAGLVAIFGQSAFDVITGRGEGYFDSLTGLLFFLLCGKLFQRKTHERLAFDRDYKSFFPLSVTRRHADGSDTVEERVAISQLQTGDRLVLRNGELLPADSRLISAGARIDYSFVTGEATPVEKHRGDYLYAGGRQVGPMIEAEVVKPVSQSYLTSLWNQEAFRKNRADALETLTNRYSQRFTKLVMAVALGAFIFWAVHDPSRALRSFTAVLIVACPCALALAAPITLGAGLRVLSRRNIFVKNAETLEALAEVDTIVFDKTGTLTRRAGGLVTFEGPPLHSNEAEVIRAVAAQSVHPCAARIEAALTERDWDQGGGGAAASRRTRTSAGVPETAVVAENFREVPGYGIEAIAGGRHICIGSEAWLARHGVLAREGRERNSTGAVSVASRGETHVAIDGKYRGCFYSAGRLRPEVEPMIRDLRKRGYELALLSGDNEAERSRFEAVFGSGAPLHFHQSPIDKLEFLRNLKSRGRRVLMVGDGLNDAGALKQSDVGIAVVEDLTAFSPASDVILPVDRIGRLPSVLRFSKAAVRIVQISFAISALYNVMGLSFAARGLLSPVICAVLMPVSSVTVVAFACVATQWIGRRSGLDSAPDAGEIEPSLGLPDALSRVKLVSEGVA